jgi:hypothetical protein
LSRMLQNVSVLLNKWCIANVCIDWRKLIWIVLFW